MNRTIFVVLSVSIGTAMAVVGCRTSQEARGTNVGTVERKQLSDVPGNLSGSVFDQNGMPLKGVKVTAGSESDGSTKTVYTNDAGDFRFIGLTPGIFAVTATSPGLSSVRPNNVVISNTLIAESIFFVMEVRTQEQAFSVVEKAPVLRIAKAKTVEVFECEFLNNLPLENRTELQGVLANQLAGAVGSQSTQQFRGGSSNQNSYQLEGFQTNDASGGRGQIITYRTVAALEMPTGGYGAESPDAERYGAVTHNPFMSAVENPLSTFSIDVDTASYANVRRFLDTGKLPPAGAVRVEELVNYFKYSHPTPKADEVFATSMELSACPWNPEARLLRIGIRGMDVPAGKRVPSNLVFLIDVSGSMAAYDKLPLVQDSLRHLVTQLNPEDRVAIVVYAGAAGAVLPSTAARRRADILHAINNLSAGGSTNGGEGIALAYKIAQENFIKDGNNRVFIATDGDFNVGVTSESELVSLVEKEAKKGVFLSVLGFGTGNLNDSMMEQLADRGDGNHSYIDTIEEGKRVLGANLTGTMLTIAKDVKLQIEWNPARVGAYRLVGYENRMLAKEDFNDDGKDAGDLGSGHTVTALYEVLAPGAAAKAVSEGRKVDELKYIRPAGGNYEGDDLLTLKVRYKAPRGGASSKREWTLADAPARESGTIDQRFATSVAMFGMLMRGTPTKAPVSYESVLALAESATNNDPERQSLVGLIRTARRLAKQ